MKADRAADWVLQWQPAGGGATRRFVLSRQGARLLLLALVMLVLLLLGGSVAAGHERSLAREAFGTAELENGLLRARADALHARAALLLGRLRTLDDERSPRAGDPSR